jgi:hypothetical protein
MKNLHWATAIGKIGNSKILFSVGDDIEYTIKISGRHLKYLQSYTV